MAVKVRCDAPQILLDEIKASIRSGSIETWQLDSDGDFTHAPEQWRLMAWLRPRIEDDKLVLTILAPKNTQMSRTVYAVYHGRFIEMLLTHFDQKFSLAWATALPSSGDRVRGS